MAVSDQFVESGGAWSALQKMLASDNLAQAYIFEGPTHVGKSTLAQRFAAEILALKEADKVARHPDFLLLGGDEEEISADAVRGLQKTLSLYPYSASKKVAVLTAVEIMNASAANALLKVLEEPSATSILILLTADVERVLPTIKSRCQIFSLRPVGAEKLRREILSKHPDAEKILAVSLGLPGLAVEYAQDAEKLNEAWRWREAAGEVSTWNAVEKLHAAESWASESRGKILSYLNTLIVVWRENLLSHLHSGSVAEVYQARNHLVAAMILSQEVRSRNVNLRLALENFYLNL